MRSPLQGLSKAEAPLLLVQKHWHVPLQPPMRDKGICWSSGIGRAGLHYTHAKPQRGCFASRDGLSALTP